jgi:hypothetical protein
MRFGHDSCTETVWVGPPRATLTSIAILRLRRYPPSAVSLSIRFRSLGTMPRQRSSARNTVPEVTRFTRGEDSLRRPDAMHSGPWLDLAGHGRQSTSPGEDVGEGSVASHILHELGQYSTPTICNVRLRLIANDNLDA